MTNLKYAHLMALPGLGLLFIFLYTFIFVDYLTLHTLKGPGLSSTLRLLIEHVWCAFLGASGHRVICMQI